MSKTKASTQQHLDIDDIKDDLVFLKTGWVAMVMSTTAINFDLLSEAEQDATIYAYGAFLNSLTFPLQVLIRSKKADITAYFQNLEEAEQTQPNPDLKKQIQKYKNFIQETVQQKTVLDKRFYLIITFSPLEAGIRGISAQKNQGAGTTTGLLQIAKSALMPKRDHVIKQTARLGINTRQLTSQELVELFYDIYNPAPTGTQRVLLDTVSYTTPLVEPSIANPTPVSDKTVEKELPHLEQPKPEAKGPTDLRPVPPASTLGGPPTANIPAAPTPAPPPAPPTQAQTPNPYPTGGSNK